MRQMGMKTGHEHAVLYDTETLREIGRKTDRQKGSVGFPADQFPQIYTAGHNIEIVHNHPSSSSLSMPDLMFSTNPGVRRIVAVGHDGTRYAASPLVSDKFLIRDAGEAADRELMKRLRPVLDDGKLNMNQVNALHSHARNQSLHNVGIIKYRVDNISGSLRSSMSVMGNDFVDSLINYITENIKGYI